MNSLIYASAKTIAAAIRNKEVSSYEVVTACVSRIEEINPTINAVVQETFEQALDLARQADDELRHGNIRGQLHGVPMTIKDSLDTAGVITTAGTTGRKAYVPRQDATVVARLRDAGAILLGKTNTPELTLAGITDNYVYGRTNNPYDTTRTPSGSSGGAAAIVAAGGVPFDIGSDAGGSIRMPSHYCGIAGIKPTFGRVPRTGHVPSIELGYLASIFHVGPLARYVEDLVLLLPIISGVDYSDPATVSASLGDPGDIDLAQLRVAYYRDNGIVSPTSDTERVLSQVVDFLSDSGLTLIEDRPANVEQASDLFYKLISADGGAAILNLFHMVGTALDEMHPSVQWTLANEAITTAELSALLCAWNIYQSQMLNFLKSYDAIICPASSTPAPKHEDPQGPDFSYTHLYNLTGWPAAVVRAGTSSDNLPIGVQVVARPWHENTALAIAHKIEKGLGGWQMPPI